MFQVLRHWLDKGVDGFRLDIFHCIYKDKRFPDNPFALTFVPAEDLTAAFFQRWEHTIHQPETFELAQEMRTLADSYSPERLLLGELYGDDDTMKEYLGERLDRLNLVFLWKLKKLKMNVRFFKDVIRHYETHYPAPYTPVYVFGNHDERRVISKIGCDVRKAKLLALFQFTVRGVPVTYYGEEIGMADSGFPPRLAQDPVGQRFRWVPGFLLDLLDLYVNRDGCRTPMQWEDGENAGFCREGATPWLPVHESYTSTNVQKELADEDSLLNVYRELLYLRRECAPLQEGTIQLIDGPSVSANLLAYCREYGDERTLIIINFGNSTGSFQNQTSCNRILLAVGLDKPTSLDSVTLPSYSGLILSN